MKRGKRMRVMRNKQCKKAVRLHIRSFTWDTSGVRCNKHTHRFEWTQTKIVQLQCLWQISVQEGITVATRWRSDGIDHGSKGTSTSCRCGKVLHLKTIHCQKTREKMERKWEIRGSRNDFKCSAYVLHCSPSWSMFLTGQKVLQGIPIVDIFL